MTLAEQFVYIAKGGIVTLKYTISALFIGLLLGSCLAVLRQYRLFKRSIDGLVSVLRGTPLILQLSFFYFALPGLLHIRLSVFTAGLYAFGLNSAAYITEILRSGIQSVPKGQFEAAATLRIPTLALWCDIIMPQVIRNVFPALINEVISLLKETAIISTLGELDLMRRSQVIASSQFSYFVPLCICGAYYYLTVFIIEKLAKITEKKLYDYY